MVQDEFFPDSPRVFYDKAPLKQVICQFRFPSLLRIEAEVPTQFQERIRGCFPFSERIEGLSGPFQIPKHIADALGGALAGAAYKFSTEDRTTSIELRSATLTCETTSYKTWDEFLTIIQLSLSSFVDIYAPNFFERIGLRYVDSIDRSAIGLQHEPWSALLNNSILGELAEQFIEKNIDAIQKSIRVRNSDSNGGFLLQHGMTRLDHNQPAVYVIDFDFYVDKKTEISNAATILDALHSRAGRAWRWCIKPKLHEALGPRNL